MTIGGTTQTQDTRTVTTPRMAWVDVPKGLVVIEVVLHHVRTALEDDGARLPVVALVDDIAGPVRMPLMFLLAGLFAARPVAGTAQKLWRDKVGNLSYLVTLWSAIAVAVSAGSAWALGRPVGEAAARVGSRLLDGVQPLWFLVALAVFFGYARLVRRWSIPVQFLGAMALAAVVVLLPTPGLVERWWQLPFFLAGLHFAPQIQQLAAATALDRVGTRRAGRAWAWVGARTLPLFLVHAVTLPLAVRVVPNNVGGALAATVALVATSLAAHQVLGRVRGLWSLPLRRA